MSAPRPAALAAPHLAFALALLVAAALVGADPSPAGRAELGRRFIADSLAALAQLERGQLDSARAAVPSLVTAARGLGDSAMVARALVQQVALDLRAADWVGAAPRIAHARRLAEAVRDTGVMMRVLRAEAISHNMRRELAASDRLAARWSQLADASGDRSEQAWARSMIAWLARARGDLAAAYPHVRWALARFDSLGELPGIGFASNELGSALVAEGKYDSARAPYVRTLDVGRQIGDGRMISWGLGNLGLIEMRIGDPVLGLRLAEQSMEGWRRRGEIGGYLLAASNLSLYALQIGRLDDAAAIAREALAIAEAESLSGEIPWHRMNLGDALWAAGKRDSARLLWAQQLADSTVEPTVRVLTASSVARALAEADSVDEASAILEPALARHGATMEHEGRVQVEIFLGELDFRRGYPERVRPRLLAVAQRLDASADADFGVAAWMQIARADRVMGRPADAAAARAHALSLWEAGRERATSLEWRERRGEQARLLMTETVVALDDADAAFAALQRFKTRSLLERLLGPRGAAAAVTGSFEATALDPAEFRAATLRDGELFLEYVSAPDTTILFAVTKDGVRRHGLPGDRVFAPQIELARDAFAARPAAGGTTAARLAATALGRALLGEVTDLVAAAKSVVIAPDGVLHRVPFAALTAGGSESPLIATHRVTIAPSAVFLRQLRAARPAPVATRVLALSGGATGGGRSLDGAHDEVRRLAERFAGVETREAGAEGRLRVAAAELASYRGLHFAGHSRADDQLPWRSGVVLGPGAAGDSLLTAAEIVGTKLDAGLVVLSSCESAGGRARSGEGVSGLASAFLVAGAPAVVATLWPVDDRVTADLIERFYLGLAAGRPAGDALREAQEVLRARAATAHPFYWAGFVLLGDGDVTFKLATRALTAERAGIGIALGLVGLAAALAFAARLRGRARRGRGFAGALAFAALSAALAGPVAAAAYAPAESAAVARAAYAEQRKARVAGDSLAALAHARRAHAAWPGQWVYAYGLASAAARAGDAPAAARALHDLADLGAGPNLEPDVALVGFARSPAGVNAGCVEALERIARNAAPDPQSTVAFTMAPADSAFWPEGIAWDSRSGETYLASVRTGRVVAVAKDGAGRDLANVAEGGGWSALALAFDGRRGLVWVTAAALPQAAGYAAADSGRAAILAYARGGGAPLRRYALPAAAAGHIPGDIVVARNGDVYVSDSAEPVIWRVRAGRLEEFARDPQFRSLQGQALSDDGKTLYVADYSHGLAAVDVATRAVTWLPGPRRGTALGLDGLVRLPADRDVLYAVQNGLAPPRVVRIRLIGRGAERRIDSIETVDRNTKIAGEPTILAADGARLRYVANSQWEKYDEAGVRKPGTELAPPTVLEFIPGARIPIRPLE